MPRYVELHHWRTQPVVARIVPHPSHLTRPLRRVQLTKARQPRKGTWFKGKEEMLWGQSRHTLTWCGMHFKWVEGHRWINSMDSETDCGNWSGFSQSSWWWKSKDYSLKSSLGRIRQERRHLGAHHASTGIKPPGSQPGSPWVSRDNMQSIRCYRLVMPKESSPMMMTHTGNASSLQCQGW